MTSPATAPLVTIGVTCYNAQDTIERAIQSALGQDWPNVEIIVVDDVSTDNSWEILRAIAARARNVQVFRNPVNSRMATGLNRIIEAAKGDFVAFFDDDDESLPNRIADQIGALTTYEDRSQAQLIACFASGVRKYPNGYTKFLPAIGSQGGEAPNGPSVADFLLFFGRRRDWFYGWGTPASALLARRSTFAAVDGFDVGQRRVADVEFSVRLALAGGHFVGTREVSIIQYATEAADKRPEVKYEAWRRLIEKHEGYLRAVGRYDYATRWSRLRYHYFSRQYVPLALELLGLAARYPSAMARHILSTGPARLLHDRRIGRLTHP